MDCWKEGGGIDDEKCFTAANGIGFHASFVCEKLPGCSLSVSLYSYVLARGLLTVTWLLFTISKIDVVHYYSILYNNNKAKCVKTNKINDRSHSQRERERKEKKTFTSSYLQCENESKWLAHNVKYFSLGSSRRNGPVRHVKPRRRTALHILHSKEEETKKKWIERDREKYIHRLIASFTWKLLRELNDLSAIWRAWER